MLCVPWVLYRVYLAIVLLIVGASVVAGHLPVLTCRVTLSLLAALKLGPRLRTALVYAPAHSRASALVALPAIVAETQISSLAVLRELLFILLQLRRERLLLFKH